MITDNELLKTILQNICYTELVYGRINKKLGINFSKAQIEAMIITAIDPAGSNCLLKKGKNYYISCPNLGMRITVNSYNYRVITVDKLNSKP